VPWIPGLGLAADPGMTGCKGLACSLPVGYIDDLTKS
jgi:hypothetical protein